MGYSRTQIANLAMSHLGDRFIANIDSDTDDDAIVLKSNYEHARNIVYEAHDWKWARRSAQLQLLPTAPTVRYDYAFALPPDFRRLANISQYETMIPALDDYQATDARVVTSAGYCFMEYVASDWSEAVWPAYFADCVGEKLAEISCMRINHNVALKVELNKRFKNETLPYARSVDQNQAPPQQRFIRSNWAKARFAGRNLDNLRRP